MGFIYVLNSVGSAAHTSTAHKKGDAIFVWHFFILDMQPVSTNKLFDGNYEQLLYCACATYCYTPQISILQLVSTLRPFRGHKDDVAGRQEEIRGSGACSVKNITLLDRKGNEFVMFWFKDWPKRPWRPLWRNGLQITTQQAMIFQRQPLVSR